MKERNVQVDLNKVTKEQYEKAVEMVQQANVIAYVRQLNMHRRGSDLEVIQQQLTDIIEQLERHVRFLFPTIVNSGILEVEETTTMTELLQTYTLSDYFTYIRLRTSLDSYQQYVDQPLVIRNAEQSFKHPNHLHVNDLLYALEFYLTVEQLVAKQTGEWAKTSVSTVYFQQVEQNYKEVVATFDEHAPKPWEHYLYDCTLVRRIDARLVPLLIQRMAVEVAWRFVGEQKQQV